MDQEEEEGIRRSKRRRRRKVILLNEQGEGGRGRQRCWNPICFSLEDLVKSCAREEEGDNGGHVL